MKPPPVLELGPCRGCGYDLRGLTPGRACPECGTPIPSGTATIGGEAGRLAEEASIGLGWIGKAALWPLPVALGCAQLSGWIGGPLLVATTGFSWLRLLGVKKVAAAMPEARGERAVRAASVECGLAAVLAASVFVASAGWIPMAVPATALVAWIAAATVATALARRLTAATVVAAGGGGSGVLESAGTIGLVTGGAALAVSRLIVLGKTLASPGTTGIQNAVVDAVLVGLFAAGLVAAAAGAFLWFSTVRLADEIPSMPRFRPKRGPLPVPAHPPRPEPVPLEVASPRRESEREPIELEPPTLPRPAREAPAPPARTAPPAPGDPGDDDDELWNGWKS